MQLSYFHAVARGQTAEAGVESVWTVEAGRDAFVPLTALASVLQRVRVGTSVAQFARPPVLTALSAMALAEYTQGRFVLGIGTGLVLAFVVKALTPLPAAVAPWSIALAVFLGVAVGIAAGVYPASRASRLDPIVALRPE